MLYLITVFLIWFDEGRIDVVVIPPRDSMLVLGTVISVLTKNNGYEIQN